MKSADPPVRPRVRPRRCATPARRCAAGAQRGLASTQPAAGLEDAALALEDSSSAGGGASSCCSAARSTSRCWATPFQRQGEIRFARNIDLPPAAAASWIATARSWPSACPRRRSGRSPRIRRRPQPAPPARARAGHEQRRARRAPAAPPELRVVAPPGRRTGRQGRCRARPQGDAPGARVQSASTRGRAAARVVGSTNADERSQEGVEFAHEHALAGNDGKRRVIRIRAAASSGTSAKACSRWTATTCA